MKRINGRKSALIIEIIMTLIIGVLIVTNSMVSLQNQMKQNTNQLQRDYNAIIDSYKNSFQIMTIMIEEKIKEDVSFNEMDAWLKTKEQAFKNVVGDYVYDGIALTYKGGYAHSWNYGEYSDYDPNTRPWYQQARKGRGKIVVVAPYVTYLDPSYFSDDEYILMTIAQKYNDEISYDLDLKIKGISALLNNRNLMFSNEDLYLIDSNGYILSSSDSDVYCHNINTVDDSISEDFSQSMVDLKKDENHLKCMTIDGQLDFVYCGIDKYGNSFVVVVSAWELFLKQFGVLGLIIVLLIIFEIYMFKRSEKSIDEFKQRDLRSNQILDSTYDMKLFIDLESLRYSTRMGEDQNKDYSVLYESLTQDAIGTGAVEYLHKYMSPEILSGHEPDAVLEQFTITQWAGEDTSVRSKRKMQYSLIVTIIDQRKIATILRKDVTKESKKQQLILESMASHYHLAFLCTFDSDTFTVIRNDKYPTYFSENDNSLKVATDRFVDMMLEPEYEQIYRENLQSDLIAEHLRDKSDIKFYVKLNNGHWVKISIIKCSGYLYDHHFLYCHSNADEEMRIQEELRVALADARKASAAKGDFLSKMSHEIRTPLNAVIGYLSMARKPNASSEKIEHCLENSEMASKHLLSVINDILDMSAIESGKLKISKEEYNFKEQIASVSAIFYNQAKLKDVIFKTYISKLTEEWVVGDQLRINQILMNLLSNAVKFTPEGGTVVLNVEQLDKSDGNVRLQIKVSDTGIGMSPEYMSKLFSPFEQEDASTARKFGGSGLGLSIANNLAIMMGGKLSAESTPNEGSTFTLDITFGCAEHTNELEAMPHDFSKIRAILVDDQENERQYVGDLLKRCGVKTTTVTSGKEAVKKIMGRIGTDYPFDICIMDWNMPEQDGIETTRLIHEKCDSNIPVIIMTAYDITEIEDEAKAAGVNKVIVKPLFQSSLFDILVSTFGKYKPKKEENITHFNMKGIRVLLAEDNEMNMEIAVDTLENEGIIVDKAENGKIACDKFLASSPGTYKVILMDIQMPVMDGHEATRTIRNSSHLEAKTIPIIAMTANAFAEDVEKSMACGMDGHISKPVAYNKLFSELSKCLNKTKKI